MHLALTPARLRAFARAVLTYASEAGPYAAASRRTPALSLTLFWWRGVAACAHKPRRVPIVEVLLPIIATRPVDLAVVASVQPLTLLRRRGIADLAEEPCAS